MNGRRILLLLLSPVLVMAAEPPAKGADPAPEGPLFTDADVAPYFPDGPLGVAHADLLAERYEAAAQGFARAVTPEGRFLRAVALLEGKREAEALRVLAGLEGHLPDLADRIVFLRGRAAEGSGERRAAIVAYGSVRPGSLLWDDAQLARARVLREEGESEAAMEALAPLLARVAPGEPVRDSEAEALLLDGQLRAARGKKDDPVKARRAFIDCWAGRPLSATASKCLGELEKLPGDAGKPPTAEDTLRRAEALLDQNRNKAALAALAKLLPDLPPAGESFPCRVRFALGKAYRKERSHSKAIEVLDPVVKQCRDPKLRVRALYFLSSSASIVAPDDGVTWYRMLASEYPTHPLADDALFFAADLLARAERPEDALATLIELSEKHPTGDFRPEGLFRAAWLERRAKRAEKAIALLERIERDYEATDPYEFSRAVYWRGRLLLERNDSDDGDEARKAWRMLAERFPLDYYGLLARERLEEVDRGSSPAWPSPRLPAENGLRYRPGALLRDPHFRAGVLLLRFGLARQAVEELTAVDRKLLSGGGDGLLLVAELLERAGDHRAAHYLIRTMGRSVLRKRPEGAAIRLWRVAFPLVYREQVERSGKDSSVPPSLLLALMREESGLDPRAVSSAGATGLTQLMLPTAKAVAKRLKMGKIRQADLMNPAISIRIGSDYFGSLLRRHGSDPLAMAAYNAGDAPVKRWLAERGDLPLDAFIEEIPIQETRGYVKRVFRSYAVYHWLYGIEGKRPTMGQALPRTREAGDRGGVAEVR